VASKVYPEIKKKTLVQIESSKCWPKFYMYAKNCKGYRENILAFKDCTGRPIIDPLEKANFLNYYYSSVFSREGNMQHMQCASSSKPFTIVAKIIVKRVAAIGKNESIRPDGISGEILKLGGEAMIPYLA